MDTSSPVLSGLIRKRQELINEMDAVQSRLRQLVFDIDALDASIRLFEPDIDLNVVKVRPTPRWHEAHRGSRGGRSRRRSCWRVLLRWKWRAYS